MYNLSIHLVFFFIVVTVAMADNIVEYAKHCVIHMEGTRRRKCEYNAYGGQKEAIEAAKCWLARGKSLMADFDSFKGQPKERKEWIVTNFGASAEQPGKALQYQRTHLIYRLADGDVGWVEAEMMHKALQASPLLADSSKFTLVFVKGSNQFKATVMNEDEDTSKLFDDVGPAQKWILHMAKGSEASMIENYIVKYICIYIEIFTFVKAQDRNHIVCNIINIYIERER